MQHDAHGWWIAEAGAPPPLPALRSDTDADVVIVGGGFTGLWTAWHLLEADADVRIVLLEADRCGFGPSGRNGGFVQAMTLSRPTLTELFGARGAEDLVAAAEASVREIGEWTRAQGVDAWYHAAPHLIVHAAPGQEHKFVRAVEGEGVDTARIEVDAGDRLEAERLDRHRPRREPGHSVEERARTGAAVVDLER